PPHNNFVESTKMSVIKKPGRTWLREWTTKKGLARSAWAVDYYSANPLSGRRKLHRKQFPTENEALAFAANTFVEANAGQHVPDSQSCTVAQAGELWLTNVKAKARERSTINFYEMHVRVHINPRIGHLRLTDLTLPQVSAFED